MLLKKQDGLKRISGEEHNKLNVGQINGQAAWGYSALWKSRANPLSLPSSLPLQHMEIWHVWQQWKREQTKGWVTNAVAMAS